MNTNTSISEMHSILERTLSFRKRFKKGKNLKINKINIESELNKDILNNDFIENSKEKNVISRYIFI